MKIKNYACPVCGSPCKINGSHYLSPLLKQAYAQCKNPLCSASWLINIEVANYISPPAGWLQETVDKLGITQSIAPYFAVALRFLQEGNPNWSEEEAVAQCCSFLQNQAPNLPLERALFFAQRAMAELKGLACEGWHIRENSGQSLVLTQTGETLSSHCISLPELVQMIERR